MRGGRARSALAAVLVGCASLSAVAKTPPSAEATAAATAGGLHLAPDALNFIVVGDWGRFGSPPQRAVATQMARTAEALDAKFIISTGDNFYPNGVASVDDPQWQLSYEQVYTDYVLHNDWYVVLGNHDYHGNPQAEVDYTHRSQRWHLPARYYTVQKRVDENTDAQFFFIDTTPFIADYRKRSDEYALDGTDPKAQLAWLEGGLAASHAQWKFVVGHHHIYSGAKRGTQAELESALVPLFKRYGVQAYIDGHEHDLQVIRRKDGKTTYLVSGTGAEHTPVAATEGTLFSASAYGFMALSLGSRELRVQVVDETGTVRFSTSIAR
ncbi:MAG TPA: tartrate-resistant acid phosphatase type 5 family protein [Rudaea sp.]|nr:tartrate-resistant acid phosphatase type 5 family protein [Rudaea sp.]